MTIHKALDTQNSPIKIETRRRFSKLENFNNKILFTQKRNYSLKIKKLFSAIGHSNSKKLVEKESRIKEKTFNLLNENKTKIDNREHYKEFLLKSNKFFIEPTIDIHILGKDSKEKKFEFNHLSVENDINFSFHKKEDLRKTKLKKKLNSQNLKIQRPKEFMSYKPEKQLSDLHQNLIINDIKNIHIQNHANIKNKSIFEETKRIENPFITKQKRINSKLNELLSMIKSKSFHSYLKIDSYNL